MPGPKERLSDDLKVAMKSGDTVRREQIRFVLAAIKQVEIDTRQPLTDPQVYDILQSEAKKRRDTIAEARTAHREDLAVESETELTLIESYLPTQLTRDEIMVEARAAIAEVGAKSPKDSGSVMKVLIPRLKNRADGKLVNEVIGELLRQSS